MSTHEKDLPITVKPDPLTSCGDSVATFSQFDPGPPPWFSPPPKLGFEQSIGCEALAHSQGRLRKSSRLLCKEVEGYN